MAAIASRYARAFTDAVFDLKLDTAKTIAELEQFSELVKSSAELRNVFDNPAVPHQQKLGLLDALVAQAGASGPVRNFLAILMDKRRFNLLPVITAQVKTEINERLGFADAEIVTSRELGAEERSALEAQIAKVTGKMIRGRYSQDKSVLGGAVVKVGSTVYDGSVKGQLERIKLSMMS
jgi:F-type H+-transporting ATPase subunit delta